MVAEVSIRITADGKAVVVAAQQATDALQGISNQAGKTSATLQDTQKSSAGLNASFADMGKAGIVFAAVNSAASGLLDVMTRLPTSGIQFAAQIEVTNVGMAGILSSMTAINGRATTYAQGLEIASGITAKLQRDAMLTAASTKELVNAFQAMVGPGLAAGMSLDQIRQFATVGVNAVKSLGMEGTQIVQELRDLVQGGITPASSTLATALGLKDSDIAKAKASSEGLFSFLMGKMKGFAEAGPAYAQTFTGVMDQMQEQLVKSAATVFAPLAGTLKDQAKGITDALGNETNVAQLSKLTGSIQLIAGALGTATQFAIAHSEAIVTVVQVYGSLKMGTMVAGWVASTEAMLQASAASRLVAMQAAAEAVANTEVTLTARQKIAAYLTELAAKEASAQATVAETAGKIVFLNVSVAALELSRSEVVAKMASTRSTIAQAQAQLAAAQAAGAQSFALAIAAEATNTLSVAQARQSVLMAEMTLLGQQQTGVHAAIAAATAAQTLATEGAALATNQLEAAERKASVSAGAFGSVIGALGGPVGIAIAAMVLLIGKMMEMRTEGNKVALDAQSLGRVKAANSAGTKAESRDTNKLPAQIEGLKSQADQLMLDIKNNDPWAINGKLEQDRLIRYQTQLATINKQVSELNGISAAAEAISSKTGTEVQINGATATKALDDLLGKEKTVTSLTAKAKEETAALVSELAKVKLNTNVSPEVATAKENEVAEAKKAIAIKLQGDLKQLREKGMGEAQAQANAHYGVTKAEAEKQAAIALQGNTSLEMANELGYRNGLKSEAVYFADKLALRLKGNADEQAANQTKIDEETRRLGAKSMNPAARDGVQAALIALETKAIELRTKALALEGEESVRVAELKKKAREAYDADVIKIALKSSGLNDETHALQLQTQEITRQGIAIDSVATLLGREEAARYGVSLAFVENAKLAIEARGATEQEMAGIEVAIAQLTRLKDAAAGVAEASAGKDVAQAGLDQAKRLLGDKSADPFKDFGTTLRATFASAGDGLQKMTDAMSALVVSSRDYGKEMQVISALRDTKDPGNIALALENEIALTRQTSAVQLDAYANMAGAAKTYFDQNSEGYRVLNGIEQAMHLVQMANMAEKLYTSLFVTTTSLAADEAAELGRTTTTIAQSALRAIGRTAEVLMSFAASGGWVGAIAGAVFVAAVLGSSKGGDSVSTTAPGHDSNGTGGVFGNTTAQDESIKNGLALLATLARPELTNTNQMVRLLQNIDNSLSSTSNALIASGFNEFANSFGGTNISTAGFASKYGTLTNSHDAILGPLMGKIGNAVFGGDTTSTSSTIGAGLNFNSDQSLASAAAGLDLQNYLKIQNTSHTDGGWFRSDSNSSWQTVQNSAADAGVTTSLQLVMSSSLAAMTELGKQIGVSSADMLAAVNKPMGLSQVDLKGLSMADQKTKLAAVVGAALSDVALAMAPELAMMQKANESYLDTLVRVASGLSISNTWAKLFGHSLLDVSIEGAQSAAKLADAFGGLAKLSDASAAFYDAFYTPAERAANSQVSMTDALATANLVMPKTKDQFRALAGSLDKNTDSGRAAYAVLLSLAPEFSATADAIASLAADASVKLMAAVTGNGELLPALNAAALKVGDLTGATTTMSGELSFINSIMGDSTSNVISFSNGAYVLGTNLSDSQVSAGLLSEQIYGIKSSADKTIINFAQLKIALLGVDSAPVVKVVSDVNGALGTISSGVVSGAMKMVNKSLDSVDATGLVAAVDQANTAFKGVNTETFVATIGLVFESLASRIKTVLGDITTERIAIRDAALSIINPTVMSKLQIENGISSINTVLPTNAGVVAASEALKAADIGVSSATSSSAASAAAAAAKLASVAAASAVDTAISYESAAKTNAELADANLANLSKYYSMAISWGIKIPTLVSALASSNAAAEVLKTATANRLALEKTSAAASLAASSAGNINAAEANAALTKANAIADAAAAQAKQAVLDYASAMQSFVIDSSKSVGKLTKLREETVKYYEAQKALADLMTTSAAGIRKTITDYQFAQKTDEQKYQDLAGQFSSAYTLSQITTGSDLASYGDKINALINPMIDALKATGRDSLIASYLAQAEAVATNVDNGVLSLGNYQQDSLSMLGNIDATLAALDASSQSAEKIISDAVSAGADKTAAGLHAVIAAITGQSVPAFATGGIHTGGWRLVGENGPEMENTGPSQIFTASQTRGMFAGGGQGGQSGNAEMVAELRALRQEVANLRIEARATVVNTGKTAKQLDRLSPDGDALQTRAIV